ncbi:MAG TPA: Uma2 family endonuclease [Thermoanaerobaculia bacterium]|jgi:Uma2 family endonuclease
MTAEELIRLPNDPAGYRHELVAGHLKKVPFGGFIHGRCTAQLLASLGNHVRQHHLGAVCAPDTGFMLERSPDTVLAPDVSFVRAELVEDSDDFGPFAPDLAVEVLSAFDRASEMSFKISQYLRAGTRAVIVVDPAKRTVYVNRASGADMVTTIAGEFLEVDDVVPGWKMPLSEIFVR